MVEGRTDELPILLKSDPGQQCKHTDAIVPKLLTGVEVPKRYNILVSVTGGITYPKRTIDDETRECI